MRPPQAGSTVEHSVLGVVLAFVGVLVVYPLVRLAAEVWGAGPDVLGRVADSPGLGEAIRHTLLLGVVVTAITVPIGAGLALALSLPHVPWRPLWRVALLLPVVVPQFVLGYSWTAAFDRAGLVDQMIGLSWSSIRGPVGVTIVLVVNLVPLAYLLTAVGLAARAEPDLVRAARVSGARPLAALRTVTLPLLRPSMAAASVLVFVISLESFAIPQVLGAPAGFETVTTRIYSDLTFGADPFTFEEALVLALLLVIVALLVIAPADLLLGPRLRVSRSAQSSGAPASVGKRWHGRLVAVVIACYLGLAIVLPLVALVAVSLTRAVGLSPTPNNLSLDHFHTVLTPTTFDALSRSFCLSAAAATLLTVLGTAVAALERRRAGRSLATVVTLTVVLPGSTLAVALLVAYGRWIGGTLAMILLAYLAKLWAFAHRPVSGAIDRLPADEVRAARVSGAGPLTALRTVALRPLAPALVGAWLICFLTALHEVTMSSLLYGPDTATIAVVVLNQQELGQVGPTAALSVVLTVLTLAAAVPLWLVARRLRPPEGRSEVGPLAEVPGVR